MNGPRPSGPPNRQSSKPQQDDEKKGVTFEDEVQGKKEKEKTLINKTRTMRPKEKWEWAFNRILKDIEVRRPSPIWKSRTRTTKLLWKHELEVLVELKLESFIKHGHKFIIYKHKNCLRDKYDNLLSSFIFLSSNNSLISFFSITKIDNCIF